MSPPQIELLRHLLLDRRVAALGTVDKEHAPFVSLVPFAWFDRGKPCVLLHVSRLATHTGNMLRDPRVSLMVAEVESGEKPVQGLGRVTLEGRSRLIDSGDVGYADAQQAYLQRLPDAAELFNFGDFGLFVIEIQSARFVAGFAQALTLRAEAIAECLR